MVIMAEDTRAKCIILKEGIIAPSKKTKGAAGFDIYMPETITIEPQEQKIIPCGFKLVMPVGLAGQIMSRSSTEINGLLQVYRGLIDCDYVHEINLLVKNVASYPIIVKKHTRLAQLVLLQIYTEQLDILGQNTISPLPPQQIVDRGGPFGSTGN